MLKIKESYNDAIVSYFLFKFQKTSGSTGNSQTISLQINNYKFKYSKYLQNVLQCWEHNSSLKEHLLLNSHTHGFKTVIQILSENCNWKH